MNTANALGFIGFGLTMWVLPWLCPGWFPHTAIDGSSTRALWTHLMGLVQAGLGAGFLAQGAYVQATAALARLGARRGAVATAEWAPDAVPAQVISVDHVATATDPAVAAAEPVVLLRGRRAALWRMFEKAAATEERMAEILVRSGPRRLAAGARHLAASVEFASREAGADAFNAMFDLLAQDMGRRQSGEVA